MARLFCCGFELAGNAADEVANVTGGGTTATVTTTSPRSGARCGRITSLASGTRTGWGVQFVSALSSGPFYCRVAFKLDTAPSAANTILAWTAGASVASVSVNDGLIKVNSDRTLTLHANGSQVGSASSALTLGQWYVLTMTYDNSPASGSKVLRAHIDGVEFAGTATSSNVGGTTNGMALGGNLTGETQTAGDWSFDDWAVNDSTGSAETGLPDHQAQLLMLRPNAAGDANAWLDTSAAAGSTSNYTLVDDDPANATTDLVQSATADAVDLYGFGASGLGTNDTINLVAVYQVSRNAVADAATAFAAVARKTSGGTQAQGTALVVNNTSWRAGGVASGVVVQPNLVAYTDPDASAWTTSTVDSMQAGQKITAGGTNRIQVTAVWAYVEYVESQGTSYTPTAGPDTAAVTDAAAGAVDRPRTAGPDGAGLEDSAAAAVVRTRALADSAGLVDTAGAALSFAADAGPDGAGAVDAAAAVLHRLPAVADTADVVDQAAGTLSRVRARADTAGITDQVVAAFGATHQIADTVGIADSAVGVVTQREQVSDTAGIADQASPALSRARAAADTAAVADQVVEVVGARKEVTDTAGIADQATATLTQTAQATDGAGLDDQVAVAVRRARTVTVDRAGLGDGHAHILARPRAVADAVGVVDAAEAVEGLIPERLTDAAALTDQVAAWLSRPSTVADTAGVNDRARARVGVPMYAHPHDITATGSPAVVVDTTAHAGVGRTA